MKNLYTLLVLILSGSLFAQAPTFQWAKGGIGSTGNDAPNSITTDATGNIYTTGRFYGTVDFDPDAGVVNLTANGAGTDVFITKTDASGNLVWAKRIGGTDQDEAYAIKLDASGNVYIAGYFALVCDFDPGVGIQNLGATNLSYQSFILKLDNNGNYIWADRVEASNSSGTNTATSTTNYAKSIAIDASGNVYLTGYFVGTTLFGNTTILVGNTVADIYLMKYNAAGTFSWVKQIGSAASETPTDMATDTIGNIYMIGQFTGTLDFDPNPLATTSLSTTGGNDTFLLKLDTDGNFVWVKKTAAGAMDEFSRSLKINVAGDIYLAGNYSSTTDFDPTAAANTIGCVGVYDNFISKFDSSGTYYWTKVYGGTGSDYIASIALDSQNNIYATGFFTSMTDFDPSSSSNYTIPAPAAGNSDVYVLKWTASGDFVWVRQFGGINGDESGTVIAIDSFNNVITAGTLSASGNYNFPGSTILATHGSNDIFLQKMQSGTLGTESFDLNSFKVFPNPSTGLYTVTTEVEANYAIRNLLGQTIKLGKLNFGENSITIENQAKGIYLLQFYNGKTIKLIKS